MSGQTYWRILLRGCTRRCFLFVIVVVFCSAFPGPVSFSAPQRTALKSSVLAAAEYDAATQTLQVEFHSGAVYRYVKVPPDVFTELLAASSKGHYFSANIRNRFTATRVQ